MAASSAAMSGTKPQDGSKETDNMAQKTSGSSEISEAAPSFSASHAIDFPWATVMVWPLMMTLPLIMNFSWPEDDKRIYQRLFAAEWYEYRVDRALPLGENSPKPLGLSLGILAVAIGQIFVWVMFYIFKFGHLTNGREPVSIQTKGARPYEFLEGLMTHASQPEGFGLLGGYLTLTWMLRLMPDTYYDFSGGIEWSKVAACLVSQDVLQYVMHRLEHDLSPTFYQKSHKLHHKFKNPRLFDAFNGSLPDTICMILLPLYATANIVHCNVWTYMAFGSAYANWLTLIHSEYTFPWDRLFHMLGFGTSADHHVHHAFFKYNYGHLFMWFDMIAGTYKDPLEYSPKAFNENI